jgi:hypothetical protein
VVLRECAGRNFSSPPAEKYRSFCSSAAQNDPTLAAAGRARKTSNAAPADGGSADAPAATSPKQDAIDKGKQLLRGLFGR